MHFRFFFSLMLVGFTMANNICPKNQELITVPLLNTPLGNFTGIVTSLGTGKEWVNDTAIFHVDIGYPRMIIGDKSSTQWGVRCDEENRNTCKSTNKNPTYQAYFGKTLLVEEAEFHLRVDGNKILNVTDPLVPKMAAQLAVGGDEWPLNDWGVIGLGPSGDFSQYFSRLYDNQASLLVKMDASNIDMPHPNFDMRIFMNPELQPADIVGTFQLPAGSKSWTLLGDHDFANPTFSFKNQKICFTNQREDIIQVPDPQQRCDALGKILCKSDIARNCKKGAFDMKIAPKLSFSIEGTVFTFEPEEYLYFDVNNGLKCRFGTSSNISLYRGCDDGTKFAFGKLFLVKYIPAFSYQSDGSATLTLLSKFTVPDRPVEKKTNWLLISVVIIAIVITVSFGIAFFVRKRKNVEDGDVYRNAENIEAERI